MEEPIIKTIQNIRTEIRELKKDSPYSASYMQVREMKLMNAFNESHVLSAYQCEEFNEVWDDIYNYWHN